MPVYLKLFHGRDRPDQDLDDWGFEGPILGPFPYVHTTYAEDVAVGNDCYLKIVDDLLVYDGKYYGDWSVFSADMLKAMPESETARVQPFDKAKAQAT